MMVLVKNIYGSRSNDGSGSNDDSCLNDGSRSNDESRSNDGSRLTLYRQLAKHRVTLTVGKPPVWMV